MRPDLAKLAMAGLIGGSMALGAAGCASNDSTKEPTSQEAAEMSYSEIHECAGHNSCKGLGGCKVSAEKLAAKAGVPVSEAGSPHECAGHNECKGLGGCSVDEAKLAKLKAKM